MKRSRFRLSPRRLQNLNWQRYWRRSPDYVALVVDAPRNQEAVAKFVRHWDLHEDERDAA